MLSTIDKPIFFIGVPRSGTTVVFEAVARHEAVAWPSIYSRTHPGLPILNILRRFLDNEIIKLEGKKKQHSQVILGNRYLPTPDEAYEFWDKYSQVDFSRSYLIGEKASEKAQIEVRHQVKKILLWQGKKRFIAKLTGPARIGFIKSIFPDAKFIHVIREGTAVINSLMNVGFWKEGGGYQKPWWPDGFTESMKAFWVDHNQDPLVLAALQWKQIIETARQEASHLTPDEYLEINYRTFVRSPDEVIDKLFKFSDLERSNRSDIYIKNMPDRKPSSQSSLFSSENHALIEKMCKTVDLP